MSSKPRRLCGAAAKILRPRTRWWRRSQRSANDGRRVSPRWSAPLKAGTFATPQLKSREHTESGTCVARWRGVHGPLWAIIHGADDDERPGSNAPEIFQRTLTRIAK